MTLMYKLNNMLFNKSTYYEYAYFAREINSIVAFESACHSFRYMAEQYGYEFNAGKIQASKPVKVGKELRIIFKYTP